MENVLVTEEAICMPEVIISSKSSDEIEVVNQHINVQEEHEEPQVAESVTEKEITSEKHSKEKKSEEIKDSGGHEKKSPKRKISFSLLFCGGKSGKKTLKIHIDDAIKSFNTHMTNFNGFSNAALCNSITGQIYATMSNDFKPLNTEIQQLLKLQKTDGETFEIDGQTYAYTHEESKNSAFGNLKSDTVVRVGIKFNKKLILVAIWSENIGKAKDSFLKCYLEIVKGNDNV